MPVLAAIKVDFDGAQPDCDIEVRIKIDEEVKESHTFSRGAEINWEKNLYVAQAYPFRRLLHS